MGDQLEITVGAEITVPCPPEALRQWCAENLVLTNPEYEKKVRLGYWTGNTPKTIALYETHGDRLILPYGTLAHILPYVQGWPFRSGFGEWNKVLYSIGGNPITLFPYQEEAVRAMLDVRYGILQSPAGSGKTQMGIEIIKRMGLPALWLTHTKDLLAQSRERALKYIDKSLIGTITEGKVNIGQGVTFATVQTMCKLDLDRYRDQWAVVIVDECHHAAGSPTMVTRFFKVLNALAAPYKFGLSATVHRSDGLIRSVYSLLGDIVHKVPDEAVKERILKVRVTPVPTGTQLTDDCLKSDGTLDYAGMINVLCIDPDRNRLLLNTLTENRERPSLILSERLDHLRDLMDALPEEMRLKACMISGKTKKAERDASLEDMREGRKQYMFATWALAKEGLDIPRLEALYMATPAKDEAVVIQAVGRVARACEGKQEPVVFDMIDPIPYCKRAYRERLRFYRRLGARI